MAGRNTVQSVGNFTASWTHPQTNGGQPVNLQGFKLDGEFFKATQIVDNSKMVLLVNGGAITLTNNNRATIFTLTCVDNGDTAENGNIVAIARELQTLGDSTGGELRLAWLTDGTTRAITLSFVTLKTFDLLILMGNDVPGYPVQFNSQDWAFS